MLNRNPTNLCIENYKNYTATASFQTNVLNSFEIFPQSIFPYFLRDTREKKLKKKNERNNDYKKPSIFYFLISRFLRYLRISPRGYFSFLDCFGGGYELHQRYIHTVFVIVFENTVPRKIS
jgi:hypothetical protein